TRTSGENLFVVLLVMAPPSQELEPPTNPARFKSAACSAPICPGLNPLLGVEMGWNVISFAEKNPAIASTIT
ncbi:hypothetical protein, partial [Ancylobacter tetraedralis]|uniref:hypothetical protein n=1 Tax=Ancylobacter tetraedralis TaxID=217068 RepID=UPI001AEDEB2D